MLDHTECHLILQHLWNLVRVLLQAPLFPYCFSHIVCFAFCIFLSYLEDTELYAIL